ncbi:MAG: Ig-like domain-containing protein [Catonella sp.]|uniref:Ig-like domain-containing protein n=1 Tax=Catonella sp. TaxID=2382125 RepID=UPI003F9F569E
MRSKQAKICSLILATAITSTFSVLPYTAKAMTEKNGVIYVTKKDVKKGKVIISKKKAKSIVIKKSVGKATIQLKNVKLSGELTFEKGDYVLKSSKSSVKTLKITGTDTKIKLNKKSDFNNKNLVLKVAKNAVGNVDLSDYGKKITAELGKDVDIALTMGNSKASVVVKKADITSKLNIKGKGEDASISKIRVESPVSLTVNINAETLETSKKANTAVIDIEKKVGDIKNEAGSSIQDKEAERIKAEQDKAEKEKAEKEKAEKEKAEKEKAEKEKAEKEKSKETAKTGNTGGGYYGGGSTGSGKTESGKTGKENNQTGNTGSGNAGNGSAGGSSSTQSKPKKTTKITLNKTSDITTDGGKTKITVTYEPLDATDKKLEWTIKEGVGIAEIISSNSNEAEIEALANGKCKIEAKVSGSNVKAETEIKIDGQDSKALENKIKKYLAYTADKLNKDNYDDVHKISTELTAAIEAKITAGTNKEKWEEYKNKVGTKVTELEGKILTLKNAETAAAGVIGNAYNDISTGSDLDPDTAKTAVETIEAKRKDVSEKVFKGKVTDENRYNEIKAEVEEYKKINLNNNPTIGNTGVVLFNALTVSAKYILTKGTSEEIESKELQAGADRVDLLKQMRKAGVGTYIVKLVKDFKHLKDVEIGKSNEKEVKLLKNESLGAVTYTYNGTDFSKAGVGGAELIFNNGKPMLKWKPIDNATSYDVVAYISMSSGDKTLGAGMLKSTSAGDNYDNIENESEFEQFEVEDHISKKGNINNKRRMCAVGLTNTEMELDKLVPDMDYFKREKDNSKSVWQEVQKTGTAIDIYIIPRNLKSLYVSNMSNVLGDASSHASKSVFITGDKFTFKVFYEKFYGKQFPYEELD